MMLEIAHREQEGIEVVDLKGRLTFGQEDLDFRNERDRLTRAGGVRRLKPWHIAILMAARLAAVVEVFKSDHDAINSSFPDREVQRY